MTNYDLFLMAQRLAGFQLTPQLSAFLYDMAIAINEKPNKVGIQEVATFAAKHDILNDAFDIKRECLTFYLAFLKDPDPKRVPAEPQGEAAKEEEPKPFRLQVGKCYKRRDGKITAPLVENNGQHIKTHPFRCGDLTWKENGQWSKEDDISPLDLIKEVQ